MVSGEVILRNVPYFRALLRSCGRSSSREGRKLHAFLLRNRILSRDADPPSSSSIGSALFHMYAACGPPATALRAFRYIPSAGRSAADWTALLSCHNRHGLHAEALRLFRVMEEEDSVPGDEVTLVCVLGACARLGDAAAGAAVHLLIIKRGVPLDAAVCNTAMDMYVKCGRMEDARRLFGEMVTRTVVSWTVILSGALRWEGLDRARQVFYLMPEKNEVTFTVMAAGYVEAGLPREALAVVAQMIFFSSSGHGLGPKSLNHVSLCSLLSACSQAGDLAVGRWLHAYSMKTTLTPADAERDDHYSQMLMASTALVDMYAKCGRIRTARLLFDRMPLRNIVVWNAMLGGLAMHGLADEVLLLFSQMVDGNRQPDDITLVTVLTACSRSGLVDQGRRLFLAAPPSELKVEHYACMVDLLGRAGHLEEAADLVSSMPVRPNEVVLGSLLASCALHGRPDLCQRFTAKLEEMDPADTHYLVLMSNMYAASGKQAAAEALRHRLRRCGVRKVPGASFITVNGEVHRFCAGDRSHPRAAEVYAKADEVAVRLRAAGYAAAVPGQICRVMDGYLAEEEEEMEQALIFHSERLAVAFGLISTAPGAPLLVFKNIRICRDCHAAVKLVSLVYRREITVRDRNRFHCFKQGCCSCSDFW